MGSRIQRKRSLRPRVRFRKRARGWPKPFRYRVGLRALGVSVVELELEEYFHQDLAAHSGPALDPGAAAGLVVSLLLALLRCSCLLRD